MTRGKVKWFNAQKGFGFVVSEELNEDVFVHYSTIKAKGFKNMQEGQVVDFEYEQTDKGLSATSVIVYAKDKQF